MRQFVVWTLNSRKDRTIVSRKPEEEPQSVLLVEGVSDSIAIRTLAQRRGIDLSAEGVAVIEMGGATGIGTYLDRYGPLGLGLRMAGLYDAGEAGVVR